MREITSFSKTLFVLDSELAPHLLTQPLASLLKLQTTASLDYLGFVEDPADDLFRTLVKSAKVPVVRLDAAALLNEEAERTSQEIVALVARVRDVVLKADTLRLGPWCSFLKRPAKEGNQNQDFLARLFWYSDLSEKNTLGQPLWWSLYRFAVVERLLQESNYVQVLYWGNPATANMVKGLCARLGVAFINQEEPVKPFSLVKMMAKRFVAMRAMASAVSAARRAFPVDFSKQFQAGSDIAKRCILALSLFPKSWIKREGQSQDRYLGTLDEAVATTQGSVMIYGLIPYDGGDYVPRAVYQKRLQQIAEFPRNTVFFVLDSFSVVADVVKAYLNPMPFFIGRALARKSVFQQAFLFRGISAWPLLGPLWWRGLILSFPYLRVLETQVERMVAYLSPESIIYYKFEYIFGRAIANAVASQKTRPLVVGMQHGPMTPEKLMYRTTAADFNFPHGRSLPQPTCYAVDGQTAFDLLGKNGIPQEILHITGPVRFDAIWPRAHVAARQPRFQHETVTVCAATGLHDFEFITTFVLEALGEMRGIHLKIKPHPKIPKTLIEEVLGRVLTVKENRALSIEIIHDAEIYETMEASDLFIATYSSTGVEAVAFGLPVILLHSRRMPDVSLFSCADFGVLSASDAATLQRHVRRLVEEVAFRSAYQKQLAQSVWQSFFEQDSQAGERLAELLGAGASEKPRRMKHRDPETAIK